MRLLLVQAHPAEARVTGAVLVATGAVVDRVGTAADAFEYLQTYEYDSVVLDQALPDMDGCEAIRSQLNRRPRGLGSTRTCSNSPPTPTPKPSWAPRWGPPGASSRFR